TPILNGHIVFLILAGSPYVGDDSKDILTKKNAPIAGNIVDGWGCRNSVDHAGMARKIGGPELKLSAFFRAGEPYFFAGGSPIHLFNGRLPRGQSLLAAGRVYHHHIASAVSQGGMFGKCHPASLGRDAHVG